MKLDHEDLGDLMPLLILADLDSSGTLSAVKATEAIGKVVDRHVAKALQEQAA